MPALAEEAAAEDTAEAATADAIGASEQESLPEGLQGTIVDGPCYRDVSSLDPQIRMWITLVGRSSCQLCDDAYEQVAQVVQRLSSSEIALEYLGDPAGWLRVLVRDIDVFPDLSARFGEEIPVVLLNGKQHSYLHVNQDRLLSGILRIMRAPIYDDMLEENAEGAALKTAVQRNAAAERRRQLRLAAKQAEESEAQKAKLISRLSGKERDQLISEYETLAKATKMDAKERRQKLKQLTKRANKQKTKKGGEARRGISPTAPPASGKKRPQK